MRISLPIATLMLSCLAPAHAQNVAKSDAVFTDGLVRTSATVQTWNGDTLQLKSAEGSLTIKLPDEVIITKRLAACRT